MKRAKQNNNRGIALLELIIYLGLLGFVLSAMVMFSVEFAATHAKSAALAESARNTKFAVTRIAYEVRRAESIDYDNSTLDTSPSVLTLETSNPSTNPTVISVVENQLMMSQGGGADIPLTPSQVEVEDFTIINVADTTRSRSIRVALTLGIVESGSLEEFSGVTSYMTTVRVWKDDGYNTEGTPPTPTPTYGQSAYRFFANDDSTDVGAPLAAQDSAAALSSDGNPFRLRMMVDVDTATVATSAASFKLQFAEKSGACDTYFVGESYEDVTAISDIAYNDNSPSDGVALNANANDPVRAGRTSVAQTYEEANNLTNSNQILAGQTGLWDFALIDNDGTDEKEYCFRLVHSSDSQLNDYSVVPEISTAAGSTTDVFRVTEYYITAGEFSGDTYDLTLDQALASNYFTIIRGSDGSGTGGGNRGPDENYVSLTADPFGTGELVPSSGSDVLQLTRHNSVDGWQGVVTVAECLGNCSTSGFELLDVRRVVHSGTSTGGTETAGASWSDIDQVMLLGGYNGAGCDSIETDSGSHHSCHVRLWPSGSNQIFWTRNSLGGLMTATSTVQVLEWGSDWTVQRRTVTGSSGGDGADQLTEYDRTAISSVNRDATWVWGTGHTSESGTGDSAEASLITLGDGVNLNSSESWVSVGQEVDWANKEFEVYALTHPSLMVDYRFKPDGNESDLTYDQAVNSATAGLRMSVAYNGSDGSGSQYPRPIFSTRYASDTSVRMERRRVGAEFPAWIQGIDFSNIMAGGGPPPSATLTQSAYRIFDNDDSTDVGAPLAAQDTAATLTANESEFRLRYLLGIDTFGLSMSGESLKLQYATKSGTCDTAFADESYADVTGATAIAFADNSPSDGVALTENANDPVSGGRTTIAQTYEENNNHTNTTAIANGEAGLWDFALVDNDGLNAADYCLRVVRSDGSLLDTYSVIPEVSTVSGCGVIFSDDFEDGDASDWVHTWDSGVDWNVVDVGGNNVYENTSSTYSQTQAPSFGDDDYVYTGQFTISNYGIHGFIFRYQDDSNFWRLVFEFGQVLIRGQVGGSWTNAAGQSVINWSPTVGTTYNIKVKAEGSQLDGKWWEDGTAEPGSWMISANDSQILTGYAGVSNRDGTQFDSLSVTTCLTDPVTGSVTVIDPNGNDSLIAGSNYEILWSSSDTSGNVDIEYSTDNFVADINSIANSTADDGSYFWTVPSLDSSTVRVRISDSADAGVTDTSDADFEISMPPSVTVTDPNGGESLTSGDSFNITWISINSSGFVDIEYSTDNFVTDINTIVAGTADDGIHAWNVPALDSSTVRVRVTDAFYAGIADTSDADFSIATPSTVTVTDPNGGESLTSGDSFNTTWTSNNTSGTVDIEYSTDNFVSDINSIVVGTLDDGLYGWTVPSLDSSTVRVRVTDSADPGVTDTSDADFSIATPSTVTVTDPNGGESLNSQDSFDVTWTSNNTSGTVDIEYSTDNFVSDINSIVVGTLDDGLYGWTVPSLDSSTVRVRVTDSADPGVTDTSDADFSISTQPTFRVTEYYVTNSQFNQQSYTLTLDQDLESNYFVIVRGSDGDGSGNGHRGPDENYAALAADPFGTGDLSDSGASNQIDLTRRGDTDGWQGVVTVVECLGDCDSSGFELIGVEEVTHSGSSTGGQDTSSVSWTDINQIMLVGGFYGAGCNTDESDHVDHVSCFAKIWPGGTNEINWSRDVGGNSSLSTATSTVMVMEWGSEWNVQRVDVVGNNGGNGADSTGEYDTASISPVARVNTWVWGTGHVDDDGIGDSAEGSLVTLGNGVNQNATESQVAVGSEYGDDKDYVVYALTHPGLAVDYFFKTDGQRGDLTNDASVDSAPAGSRMALAYNGCNGTGHAYPRPIFSARYLSDTFIRMERLRSGQAFPAWIQGIDFSEIKH